jgi:hypothetical protein
MRIFMTIGFLLVCLAGAALAADVTGKWVAQLPGRGGETHEVTFTFKADGNTLTGSSTTQRGDMEIADGKIDGDQISFTQTMAFGQNQVKLVYQGTVSGDAIKFTRTREGGDGHTQEFTAKRAQ